MKLDIVRAWKDDTYRQSLSDEQMGLLPANPAGELELTNAELQSVYGGDGGGLGSGGGVAPAGGAAPIAAPGPVGGPVGGPIGRGAASASSTSAYGQSYFRSFAFDCSDTLFSVTVDRGAFLSPVTTFCINARR